MHFLALITLLAASVAAVPTPGAEVDATSLNLPRAATHERNITAEALSPSHPYHGMEIEEKTTPKGQKYHVIRPKGSKAAEEAAVENSKRSVYTFHYPIYWMAGKFGTTSDSLRKGSGIRQWDIDQNGVFWKYRLNINTELSDLTYSFRDETYDIYNLWVFLTGHHYIDYNSNRPNMIDVSGTQ